MGLKSLKNSIALWRYNQGERSNKRYLKHLIAWRKYGLKILGEENLMKRFWKWWLWQKFQVCKLLFKIKI